MCQRLAASVNSARQVLLGVPAQRMQDNQGRLRLGRQTACAQAATAGTQAAAAGAQAAAARPARTCVHAVMRERCATASLAAPPNVMSCGAWRGTRRLAVMCGASSQRRLGTCSTARSMHRGRPHQASHALPRTREGRAGSAQHRLLLLRRTLFTRALTKSASAAGMARARKACAAHCAAQHACHASASAEPVATTCAV